MDKRWLYYDYLDASRTELYKDLLTEENLEPFKIEIRKMTFPNGDSDDEYNFRGWTLTKNNTRYLISDTFKNRVIDIRDILPVLPKKCIELGAKGLVYKHITRPVCMKFKDKQTMTFKQLIENLTLLDHSNHIHYTLMHLIGFTSVLFRFNLRVASNPGFGKDSVVETHNALVGRCGTIESPTIAKVEERASVLRWLVINEVVDIGTADWRIIQQFLLATGAHKTQFTKHSRAHGHVGEIIDLSKLSLSLFFNDITDYDSKDVYFDFVTKNAVKDRFLPLRLHGIFTEKFSEVDFGEIPTFVKEHLDEFRELIYNYTHYMKHWKQYVHGYEKPQSLKGRAGTNLNKLLIVIDMFSNTQEEFNRWVSIINNAMIDYKEMLKYPYNLQPFYSKLGIAKSVYEEFKNLNECATYLKKINEENKYKYVKTILSSKTFIEKNILLKNYSDENSIEDSHDVW